MSALPNIVWAWQNVWQWIESFTSKRKDECETRQLSGNGNSENRNSGMETVETETVETVSFFVFSVDAKEVTNWKFYKNVIIIY